MPSQPLRLVLAPWGADSAGDDVWLFENGLILAIEMLVEAMEPRGSNVYADLYDQLGGETIRTDPVRPLGVPQIEILGTRAPAGTSAVVDGQLSVRRNENGILTQIHVAPRIVVLPHLRIEAPDAFVFDSFEPAPPAPLSLPVRAASDLYELARALFAAVLEAVGREPDASNLAGMTGSWPAFLFFLKAKRLARSIEEKVGYYRQAASADPAFYWARLNLGILLKQQGDFVAARRELLAATRLPAVGSALKADALFEVGLCSIHLGDTKAARGFWDEALALSPDNPALLVNLAGTYEQEEDWHNAALMHERALTLSPGYHKALVSLARLRTMTGQVGAAIPLYHRALAVEPADPLREAILGGCYVAVGDLESARAHLQRASELDPPRADTESEASPGSYARAELARLAED